jgi:SAM-dependent methyltransferase
MQKGASQMDREQVRARIIEVARRVKQVLVKRGIAADEQEPKYKGRGVRKPRRNPFWSEEGRYKYIDDVDVQLQRLFQCFDLLNPRRESSVFEIGPGSCYLLFMCRELGGCRVAGIDWIENEAADSNRAFRMPFHGLQKYAFGLFRKEFGLEGAIRHQVVKGNQPIVFDGCYDAIIANHAMFNRAWRESKYRFWLRDCYEHLKPGGKFMIALNKVRPDALAALPCLRPLHAREGNEKLNLLSREEIGEVLMMESKVSIDVSHRIKER